MKTLLFSLLLLPLFLRAQESTLKPDSDSSFLKAVLNDEEGAKTMQVRYQNTQLDLLLQEIGSRTGKVILRDPAVQDVPITLISKNPMKVSEFLKAAESLLAMNNIALVPFREDFIKVVPLAGAERTGAPLKLDSEEEQGDEAQVISQMITLKYLDYSEVQNLISERLSQNAKVQVMERNNSLLITDTRSNIGRIQKILGVLDRPAEVRETVKIYQLSNASAEEIKSRLEVLIEESQQNQNPGTRTTTRTASPVTPRGVIRPGANNVAVTSTANGGDTGPAPGLIQGNVQIVADERTNVLIIISRPENDNFFAEMIAALDKKVDPEVIVRIHNLQFADAEEVSTTLNELIGAASADNDGPDVNSESNPGNVRGQTVRDFIRQENSAAASTANNNEAGANIIQMGENTRILADIRTNSLILMGRAKDLDVIEDVIRQLDIMLAQVAVRAVIMEVILSDNISYGIDWLQRTLTVNDVETVNGVPIREPVFSFAGGSNVESSSDFLDLTDTAADLAVNSGGLTYFSTFYDFNLDVILRLAQGSSDAKVIATPIIVTTDNTEASIKVGERRAIPTTTATTIGGSVQSSYEYENIGLELTVTPRINPQGVVILEVVQTAENVAGNSIVDGNEIPIITSRELEASVAIRSGGTLALGGLVREDKQDSVSQVPFFGSIPILGALFRSTSKQTIRTELLVLISPEVLVTAEEAESLTRQLKNATELKDADWYRGWDLPPRDQWEKQTGPDAGPASVE
ncbi:type II secretion system secretin GspD [Kiritimatiellaeota bacterium B1221]|nr:type II secretion system secretin GspD [Kiritimatiellaeota bacterium B1221]